jgi:dihydroflavonol-4-reductase
VFLLTGGAGFLGRKALESLIRHGQSVRALVLPGDPLAIHLPKAADKIEGDLLNPRDLARFFEGVTAQDTVIHCASIITMRMSPVDLVTRVNVEGTKNIIEQCLKTGARLVHVASVHAIPELPHGQVMAEPETLDEEQVVGWYAKTKAMAAKAVLEARARQGLQAAIAYPAGLCGPGDYGKGNLTQLFLDYMNGAIPMGVDGGYNFADVRDVAQAIVTLAQKESLGEDYVLSGEYIAIMDILKAFHDITGKKQVRLVCPVWLAKLALPIMKLVYSIRKVKPIFSEYSLYTVRANSLFDSSMARRDLGFSPRPIRQTLEDTAKWLMEQNI